MNKVIEQEIHLYMYFIQKSLIFTGIVKNEKIIYVQVIFHLLITNCKHFFHV